MSDFENFDVNADDYKINQTDYVVSENQAQAETLIETKPTEVIVEPEKKSETVSENNLTTEVVKSEDIKPVKVITPFKNTLLMNIQRLGVIINNISIVSFVLLVACVIGIILYPLAILLNIF